MSGPGESSLGPGAEESARALLRLWWRSLRRRSWQSALMILGVSLGVAVVVAIDLANASASQAFDLSTEALTGRTTHQIVGGPQGLDAELYTNLVREGLSVPAAPVLTAQVTSPQLENRPFQLLGVDPFAEAPFRDYLGGEGEIPLDALADFLTLPGALMASTEVADRYGLRPGDEITLLVNGRQREGILAATLEPEDSTSRRALSGLLLVDLATAQELTGRMGALDRIDLILPEGETAQLEALRGRLPEGVRVLPASLRRGSVEQMTEAFRTNLTALSLLALVVGMFLIYNTMTFSVVQRRELFGTLRCLGVTRREIFGLVLGEALGVGAGSAVVGLVGGVLLGRGALALVTQTVNDLFFVVTVTAVEVPVASLVKGAALGLIATAATAAVPAWEAASVAPRTALTRSELETRAGSAIRWAAVAGVGLLGISAGLLAIPGQGLHISFAGTFAAIVGFAALTPYATWILMQGIGPLAESAGGVIARIAPRDVVASLSRTGVAVAALMVAVSVIIGVSLMVGSFRYTVIAWLEETLQGDVYISAPSPIATQNLGTIQPDVVALVKAWPGVARVDRLRAATVDSPSGPIRISAVDNPNAIEERLYQSRRLGPEATREALQSGAVLISETLAFQLEMRGPPEEITLYTDQGARSFPVVGVYYDYGSTQGTALMSLAAYRQHWADDAITALSLRLEEGADPDRLVEQLQTELAAVQPLEIRPNLALREDALAVFDRTFTITRALQLLATVVAFIGVLSALLSLQLEKRRQLGILRAIGLTVRQVQGLVLLETGLMGLVAGVLAMPTGLALAAILIYIINRRSFGWTLQFDVSADPFVQALLIAIVAAVLAGVYPAYRMGKTITAEVLRYE